MPQQKKKRSRFLWLYLVVWIFTAAVFSGVVIIQASRYNGYRKLLADTEAALAQEQQTHQDLLDQMVYYESDAYIEELAREQLGYVKPDEIIFQNEAE
jgi:cell division protein FtsB